MLCSNILTSPVSLTNNGFSFVNANYQIVPIKDLDVICLITNDKRYCFHKEHIGITQNPNQIVIDKIGLLIENTELIQADLSATNTDAITMANNGLNKVILGITSDLYDTVDAIKLYGKPLKIFSDEPDIDIIENLNTVKTDKGYNALLSYVNKDGVLKVVESNGLDVKITAIHLEDYQLDILKRSSEIITINYYNNKYLIFGRGFTVEYNITNGYTELIENGMFGISSKDFVINVINIVDVPYEQRYYLCAGGVGKIRDDLTCEVKIPSSYLYNKFYKNSGIIDIMPYRNHAAIINRNIDDITTITIFDLTDEKEVYSTELETDDVCVFPLASQSGRFLVFDNNTLEFRIIP